jgi:hypothetical protein
VVFYGSIFYRLRDTVSPRRRDQVEDKTEREEYPQDKTCGLGYINFTSSLGRRRRLSNLAATRDIVLCLTFCPKLGGCITNLGRRLASHHPLHRVRVDFVRHFTPVSRDRCYMPSTYMNRKMTGSNKVYARCSRPPEKAMPRPSISYRLRQATCCMQRDRFDSERELGVRGRREL